MSEATQPEKPAAAAATAEKPAEAEKPAAPVEPPFTTDELQSSTARFTHKAWHLYYSNRKDMTFIREASVSATLEVRTSAGAEEIQKLLLEAGVVSVNRVDKLLAFIATFEQIQKVIKNPHTFMVDAVRV